MFILLDFAANLEEEDGLGSYFQLPRRGHTGLNLRDSCANRKETCERGTGKKKVTGFGERLVKDVGKRKNHLSFQSFMPELEGECGAAVRMTGPERSWFGGKDTVEWVFKPVD